MQRDAALAAPDHLRVAVDGDHQEAANYLVAYGKVVDDKNDGVYLQGVYFGGIATTHSDAQSLARECVNGVKGGIAFPRIVPMSSGRAIDAINWATKRFHQMEAQMIQAEEIMSRSSNRNRTRAKIA